MLWYYSYLSINVIIKTRSDGMKKKKTVLKLILWPLAIILSIWLIIFIFPVSKRADHAFFNKDKPLIIAHQGGEHLAPSGTLEAFKNAVDLGVDVLEFDIHMTKDGHLVSIHDPTVDRTTNGSGTVNEMTLKEVQALDAGDYFVNLDGVHSYQNKGVYIPTIEEVFELAPTMNFNIEIKDTNNPTLYRDIVEKLWDTIQRYGLEKNVLIASFDHDIIDTVIDVTDGEAFVSGGRQEITRFVVFHKIFLNGLYRNKVDAVQIPTEDSGINLKDRNIIRGANKRGMGVHYWTINDSETMKELIDLGVNGIITDRPDLMIDILNEK